MRHSTYHYETKSWQSWLCGLQRYWYCFWATAAWHQLVQSLVAARFAWTPPCSFETKHVFNSSEIIVCAYHDFVSFITGKARWLSWHSFRLLSSHRMQDCPRNCWTKKRSHSFLLWVNSHSIKDAYYARHIIVFTTSAQNWCQKSYCSVSWPARCHRADFQYLTHSGCVTIWSGSQHYALVG